MVLGEILAQKPSRAKRVNARMERREREMRWKSSSITIAQDMVRKLG
jgi:hypothetical protein